MRQDHSQLVNEMSAKTSSSTIQVSTETSPSNWNAFSWCVRPVGPVRVPKGRILRVTCPAGQVQLPAARSIWKSSFGK